MPPPPLSYPLSGPSKTAPEAAIKTNTLSGYVTYGIALTTNGPFTSPFTITKTGTLAPSNSISQDHAALYSNLTGAAAPILINHGLIFESTAYDSAVSFTGGGTIRNTGTIETETYNQNYDGISIGYGVITNAGSTALIAGLQAAINISGTGHVTNDGTISGIFDGINLGGGAITNAAGATIFGYETAVKMTADGTITNAARATIESRDGVAIQAGANSAITNAADAGILGQSAAIETGANSTVTNAGGSIESEGTAIQIGANSTVTNDAGGMIYGRDGGIVAAGPATIFNAGHIFANYDYGYGVKLAAGGTITNDGFIFNAEIYDGTLINNGTIGEVYFDGSAANRLVINPGATITGAHASSSASNTLELGAGTGTLAKSAYYGVQFSGFQTIAFDPGAAWLIDGDIAGVSNLTVLGFTAKDTLVIPIGITLTGATDLTLNAHGVLDIPETGHKTFALTFANANAGATFQLAPAGHGYASLTIEPSGTRSGAVTLNPATPDITITNNIDTFGIIGTYGIETNHSFTATPIGAALFAAPGTSFNVINRAHIESDSTAAANAGIVIESASTFTNAGTIIAATGIEVLGVVDGAYIDSSRILRATLGAGIYLQADGSALNTGQLTAATTGIDLAGGGYAYNSGKIRAHKDGIYLAGGLAYNYGVITAGTDILVTGTAGYADNTGHLRATHDGIDFKTSGSVVNTGTIQARATGLLISGYGIAENAGFISAANGILLTHGGTIIDSGTLIGATYAASLAASADNRFVLDPTARITGTVYGGGGTLELARAASIGTIELGGNQFTNFATIEIDAHAKWDFAGTFTAPGFTNNGTIIESATDFASFAGPITGTGEIELSQNPLTFETSVAASQIIAFTGAAETLALADPQDFAATITGFSLTDTIDLAGISLASVTGMHFGHAGLTITESSGILAFYFASPGQFGSDIFTLTAAGPGTAITLEKPAPGLLPIAPTPSAAPALLTLQA